MKKIIDSSVFSSQNLKNYLSSSKSNIVVLTDYVAMEAYAGEDFQSIYKSAEILSSYPAQIIVLKGTSAVCGLSSRTSGLTKRMVDNAQTANFEEYCRNVSLALSGNANIIRQLSENQMSARKHLNRLLDDSRKTSEAIMQMANIFSNDELKIIRKNQTYSNDIEIKIIRGILSLSKELHEIHPAVKKVPSVEHIRNSFIFRVSVCAYVTVLDRIRVGSVMDETKDKSVGNDFVDVYFMAYATYFDGILTLDAKQNRLFNASKEMMKMLFEMG